MDNKEKLHNFRRLSNAVHAAKDLELLKSKNPTLSRLPRYGRNPERYADEILYDLLDCCTASDIEKARGVVKKAAPKTQVKPKTSGKSTKGKTTKAGNGSKPKAAKAVVKKKEENPETAEKPIDTSSAADSTSDDSKKK